jgi:oxygen-independent coproporphyrinogen-3 oxidase
LSDAEITSECNPVTNTDGLFEGLLQAGVNRLSIGLQSVHENELRRLGRLHSFADFESTFAAARHAGFENISADLMFGIPAQTPASFRETLEALCDLAPSHISAYGLRVEESTPFGKHRDALPFPNEDAEAEMAELVATHLPKRGYGRYEISNYAHTGYESRHNLRYWLGADYLGFGPGAHSLFQGVRFETPPDTAAYLRAIQSRDFDTLLTNHHALTAHELREEYVMLRMRLAQGVDKAEFLARFKEPFSAIYGDTARLVEGGFLIDNDTRVAFTDRGMQVSNAILSEWLDFGG